MITGASLEDHFCCVVQNGLWQEKLETGKDVVPASGKEASFRLVTATVGKNSVRKMGRTWQLPR